ncbi:radiation sensitive protein rad9 [Teratosphaeriaceae sp. CCFEE 6253]|nr:radiation sensitive protein rad9 [Teratosphaeriaceae sp. CCFEE 6253]
MASLPLQLLARRQALFMPAPGLELDIDLFERDWLWVTNVWRDGKKGTSSDGTRVCYTYCRCRSDSSRARPVRDEADVKRKRTYRSKNCNAALKMIRTTGDRIVLSLTRPHDHTLDYMDSRGMSDALKIHIKQIAKDHDGKLALFKYIKDGPQAEAYLDAGCKHLTMDRVRSAIASDNIGDDGKLGKKCATAGGGSPQRSAASSRLWSSSDNNNHRTLNDQHLASLARFPSGPLPIGPTWAGDPRYNATSSYPGATRYVHMAAMAENSVGSIPVQNLAALQQNMLNSRQPFMQAANAPRAPESMNYDLLHRDARALGNGNTAMHSSANANQPPRPSSFGVPLPYLAPLPGSAPPSYAPPPMMRATPQLPPWQEAYGPIAHAQSSPGYPGGDTQPMDSQVYRNYTESMVTAKSATITPRKAWPDGGHGAEEPAATGRTPHTYVEGDTGYIDLENEWQKDSPTAHSTASGIDELLADELLADASQAGPQTQPQIADPSQRRTRPETPSMACNKRHSNGEIVSSASAAAEKTPGFSQLFGAVPKGPVMSATQLFGQTQAPSSPVPDAPRSDPVATRPSPNINQRPVVSSPPAHRSSPVYSLHPRLTGNPGEPRDTYTSMEESDERRKAREQVEAEWRRLATLEEDEDETTGAAHTEDHERSDTERVVEDASADAAGLQAGLERKQTALIDLVTPATVRHRGERLDFEDFEDSDVELEIEHDDRVEPEVDGDDGDEETDVYDEFTQTVLRSQPNDGSGDEDGDLHDDAASEEDGGAHHDMHIAYGKARKESRPVGGVNGAAKETAPPQDGLADRIVTATQQSAVADSQPLHQNQVRLNQDTGHVAASQKSSYVPGSQYAGRAGDVHALLRSSQNRHPASLPTPGEQSGRIPSSPPLPDVGSTLPEGSAEASLARRQVLAQFQQRPDVEHRDREREIPESDALVSDDMRPVTAHSVRPGQASGLGDSNTVLAPFSTAQTHLSAIASQQSKMSADSPRKRAGVKRFTDMAVDPSPPDASLAEALEVATAMGDVVSAEDQEVLDAISSPVRTGVTKRRKLTHSLLPSDGEHTYSTAMEGTGSVERAASTLPSRSGRAEELHVPDPHDTDAPKGTPDSVTRRENAGAAAVSQLLAARSAHPTHLAKLAGHGRKAAATAEHEVAEKSVPQALILQSSNSGVKRAEKTRQPDLPNREADDRRAAVAGDAEDAEADPLEPAPLTSVRLDLGQADGISSPVTAPRRVFALFKGSFNNFYPAAWLGTSPDGKSYQLCFDDTTRTTVDATHVRALDLRVGDSVKVDAKDMRNKIWTIVALGGSAKDAEERGVGPDIHGHSIAEVQVRSSGRNNLLPDDQTVHGVGDVVEVLVSNIYITHSLWPGFADRAFMPPDGTNTIGDRLATPSTGFHTPDIETPISRVRRIQATSRKSHLLEGSVTSASSRSGTSLFAGMAFAISYGSNEAEKAVISDQIQDNGGIILETGFDELFDQPDLDTAMTHIPGDRNDSTIVRKGLVLKGKYKHLGFVALVADRHSRRAKYMQALALGLPTLSGRWLADSLDAEDDHPVPWAKYLLAAGESAYLGGAIRSRTLASDVPAEAAKLQDTLATRNTLLNSDNVLLVSSAKNKSTWERRKTYAFLTLALGAGNVKRVSDLAEATTVLTGGSGDEWKWVYVDGPIAEASAAMFGTGHAQGGKKRKRGDSAPRTNGKAMSASSHDGRLKVVNDEFVVQSLILGALVD